MKNKKVTLPNKAFFLSMLIKESTWNQLARLPLDVLNFILYLNFCRSWLLKLPLTIPIHIHKLSLSL